MPKSQRKSDTSVSVSRRRGRSGEEELSLGLSDAPKKAIKKEPVSNKGKSKEKKSKVPAATIVRKKKMTKEKMQGFPLAEQVVMNSDSFTGEELKEEAFAEFARSDGKVSICQIIIKKVMQNPSIVLNYDAAFAHQQSFLMAVLLQKSDDGDQNWMKKVNGNWLVWSVDRDIKQAQEAALKQNKSPPCTVTEEKRTATGTTLEPHSHEHLLTTCLVRVAPAQPTGSSRRRLSTTRRSRALRTSSSSRSATIRAALAWQACACRALSTTRL
jgi:hypothetical protein